MKEYIINSKKYGQQIVLLDDDDYEKVIRVKGRQIRLGTFKTYKEVVNSRLKAEHKFFPDFKGGDLNR